MRAARDQLFKLVEASPLDPLSAQVVASARTQIQAANVILQDEPVLDAEHADCDIESDGTEY